MKRVVVYISILNATFGLNKNCFPFILPNTFFTNKHWFITKFLINKSYIFDNKLTEILQYKKEFENHYIKTRNAFFLPIRGQRTHTNARTRKRKNMSRLNRGFKKKNEKSV